jgi:hypothetical protein
MLWSGRKEAMLHARAKGDLLPIRVVNMQLPGQDFDGK